MDHPGRTSQGRLRTAVVIATLGRPAEVGQILRHLAAQTVPPDRVLLSVTRTDDVPEDAEDRWGAEILVGLKGSSVQRNLGIDAVGDDCDIVAFVDDDYVPSQRAIEGLAQFFASHPDVVGINGYLLADGIKSPGIPYDAAVDMLAAYDACAPQPATILKELYSLYGCNMAFRTSAIGNTRFDTALPFYAWLEDVDFSMQLRRRGRLVKTDAFVGVHRGVKGGRTSGVRLGYSQIANPAYLVRKGTMRWRQALRLAVRNFLANHARAFKPEPWVDRRGRLRGNWLAITDLIRGRAAPDRVVDL